MPNRFMSVRSKRELASEFSKSMSELEGKEGTAEAGREFQEALRTLIRIIPWAENLD
ncbi:hypothetical protein BH10PSE19_BH10PSE19_15410 [soil metagenome]